MAAKKPANIVSDDSRVRHSDAPDRTARTAMEDASRTLNDGTGFSIEDRRAMLRNEFLQEALPKAPEMPGYHLCWLASNSSYDPLHKRLRMGYELVRKTDMPGFRVGADKDVGAEMADYVVCNEMVLARIPTNLYSMYMEEMHHNMPAEEERKIRESVMSEANNARDSEGAKLGSVSDDFSFEQRPQEVRRPREPTFEG